MKPVLFNTEMVRAILDGRKTQTRRIVKAPVLYRVDTSPDVIEKAQFPEGYLYWNFIWHGKVVGSFTIQPPYQPGDMLYVRETWAENPCLWEKRRYIYRADSHPADETGQKWRPSIHMPKEAARIFLRVTDVRVERLQDIKNDDCVSEGAVKRPNITKRGDLVLHNRYRKEFAVLWDRTIKKADIDRYGWATNPWVWVISFERYQTWREGANE